MSLPIIDFTPPAIQFNPVPNTFDQVRQTVRQMATYQNQMQSTLVNYFRQNAATINNNSQGYGPDLASAATISPTSTIHVITGTATVSTINIPPGFNGALYLISRDGFSTATGGNIAQAATYPPTALVALVYVPQEVLFYVTAVSIPNGSVTTANLAPGAASISATVIDNTSQSIGTSDTQVGTVSITIDATSDLVQFIGFVTSNITNYGATGSVALTSKLWRGTVASGTAIDNETSYLNSTTSSTLSGQAAASFTFYDTGISGAQSYSVSLAMAAGPTLTKTRCVIVVTDFKAQ